MDILGDQKRYNIISKIGSGGMSVVYLARDTKSRKNVAIKVLQPSSSENPIAWKRFKNEVKLHSKVKSPFVVEILDFHISEKRDEKTGRKTCYLVMEYIEGKTLNEYISYRQNLTVVETVEFAKDILKGVNKLHEQDIIHRDLKASNIIVVADDHVKLIDLGIAQDDGSESLTKTDSIIGSSEYVAPEISQGAKANPQTDYYALGVLMYQMLIGSPPFSGTNPGQVLQKHINEPVPNIKKMLPKIPNALVAVVNRALSKTPDKRYQSFDEFYNALDTCLNEDINDLDISKLSFFSKVKVLSKNFFSSKSFYLILSIISVIGLLVVIILVVIL